MRAWAGTNDYNSNLSIYKNSYTLFAPSTAIYCDTFLRQQWTLQPGLK